MTSSGAFKLRLRRCNQEPSSSRWDECVCVWFQLYQWGACFLNWIDILWSPHSQTEFPCINPKKIKKKNYHNSGVICIRQCQVLTLRKKMCFESLYNCHFPSLWANVGTFLEPFTSSLMFIALLYVVNMIMTLLRSWRSLPFWIISWVDVSSTSLWVSIHVTQDFPTVFIYFSAYVCLYLCLNLFIEKAASMLDWSGL